MTESTATEPTDSRLRPPLNLRLLAVGAATGFIVQTSPFEALPLFVLGIPGLGFTLRDVFTALAIVLVSVGVIAGLVGYAHPLLRQREKEPLLTLVTPSLVVLGTCLAYYNAASRPLIAAAAVACVVAGLVCAIPGVIAAVRRVTA